MSLVLFPKTPPRSRRGRRWAREGRGRRRISRVWGTRAPTPPGHWRTIRSLSPFLLLFWSNLAHPELHARPGAGRIPVGEAWGPPHPAQGTHLRPRRLRCRQAGSRGRPGGAAWEPDASRSRTRRDAPGGSRGRVAAGRLAATPSSPAGETASAGGPASRRPSRAARVARAQPRALPPRPAPPCPPPPPPPPAEPPGAGARGRRPEGARGPGAGRKRPRPGARPWGGAGSGRARTGPAPRVFWFRAVVGVRAVTLGRGREGPMTTGPGATSHRGQKSLISSCCLAHTSVPRTEGIL